MKKPQFNGYILEEILAYLIRTNGYTLITEVQKNDPDLKKMHNGLNIRGRGAYHQIDVLGELNWIPAFNFPLRLITEAKLHNKKIGVDTIRNGVGILADINQNFVVTENPQPRYHYASVVFSTSGFSKSAVDMSIAHQIQLADLSGQEYTPLRREIIKFTNKIFVNSRQINKLIFQDVKKYLRSEFYNQETVELTLQGEQRGDADKLIQFTKNEYKKLFIGMSQGGFMLLLKADDPDIFVSYAKNHPNHNIKINWSGVDNGRKWVITPEEEQSYKLTFKLPSKLHNWIFKISNDKLNEALNQKERHFSKISIYYYDQSESRDYIFNLKFNKDSLVNN